MKKVMNFAVIILVIGFTATQTHGFQPVTSGNNNIPDPIFNGYNLFKIPGLTNEQKTKSGKFI